MRLLSIVIPTRNRASFLREVLNDLSAALTASVLGEEVEVCCVDNFSTDDTRQTVDAFAGDCAQIRYFKHAVSHPTAEESMSAAVGFARGKYVWTLGDDDRISPDAISRLVDALKNAAPGPDFVLINATMIDFDRGLLTHYFDPNGEDVRYDSVQNLFRDFGFVTHTTTISCLCFNRDLFLRNDWALFHQTSPIYSHSFGVFAALQDRPALFLRAPLVQVRMSDCAQEKINQTAFQRSMGNNSFASFHTGLLKLVGLASTRTGTPLSWFAEVQEIELDKRLLIKSPTLLSVFILRALILQAKMMLDDGSGRESLSSECMAEVDSFFADTRFEKPARNLLHVIRSFGKRSIFSSRVRIYHLEKQLDDLALEHRRLATGLHPNAVNKAEECPPATCRTFMARVATMLKELGGVRLLVRSVATVLYSNPKSVWFALRSIASTENPQRLRH